MTELAIIENRHERSYDEQTSSKVIHPNASLCETFDRGLCVAMTREVLRLHGWSL